MDEINKVIIERHTHINGIDNEQIDAIFSTEKSLVVEAPAGYGKTRTMVSKIAFLIATGRVPYPKKILALTFSINAAYKIRKDILQQLPEIASLSRNLSLNTSQIVFATNYHGLCRRILRHYGHLISSELCNIENLRGVGINLSDDDSRTRSNLKSNLNEWKIELTDDEINLLIRFTSCVRSAGDILDRQNAVRFISGNLKIFLEVVRAKFLPKGYILYDAIILFTRQLLNLHNQIRGFYRSFYPIIIVDEFQDTNILQWSLLQDLVGRETEAHNALFIFGDRCQKIYDFIGAMDGIIDLAKSQYHLAEKQLLTNHRFYGNELLLALDMNLREIAQTPQNPQINHHVEIKVLQAKDQDDEARQIVEQVKILLEHDKDTTISVLFRAGKDNPNTIKIVDHFKNQNDSGISFFYALYSDEDREYIDFHKKSLASLIKNSPNCRSFRNLCTNIQKDLMIENPSETWESLQQLLDAFLHHTSIEFRFLDFTEKIALVGDTFRNNALKQYLMYVTSSRVILSTVHGSKGLEFDYVILPDMEKNSFPSFPALCIHCSFRSNCQIVWTKIPSGHKFARFFSQELNVFYVGVTRARRSVYFTNSTKGLNYSGEPRQNTPSCFLNLPGIRENIQD